MKRQPKTTNRKLKLLWIAAVVLLIILLLLILMVSLANGRHERALLTRIANEQTQSATAGMAAATHTAFESEVSVTETETPPPVVVLQPTMTLIPPLNPEDWQRWPILPDRISPEMLAVYQGGKENGNRGNAFSKVGDSNSMMPSFLSCFDYGEVGYTIGEYTALEETISHFQRSFSRNSRAAANGITAMGLDTYHWYEDDVCWPYESATSCEYRLWQPSIAFIALGTNDAFMPIADFEKHLRSLVQKSLDRFVVPILVTKADNIEEDGSFNRVIAQVAADFQVPLLNLWRAMESLPGHGLRENDVHPTFNVQELCDFSGDDLSRFGWTVRNLTSLQALDRVWRLLNHLPLPD